MPDLKDRHRELTPLVELPSRGAMDSQHPSGLGEADRGADVRVDQGRVGALLVRWCRASTHNAHLRADSAQKPVLMRIMRNSLLMRIRGNRTRDAGGMADEITYEDFQKLTLAQQLGGPWTPEAIDAYLRPLDLQDAVLRGAEEAGEDVGGDQYEVMEKRWALIGSYLRIGRERAHLSKRAAARRAGISEGLWRHLEAGVKQLHGVAVLPNPRSENLVAAAQAVGQDPRVIFRAIGRAAGPIPEFEPADDSLQARIDRLNYRDRQLVEQLVDSMLQQP